MNADVKKMTEKCQRCEEIDDDRRTLWMSCFYDMDELKIPFKMEGMLDKENKNISNIPSGRVFYTIRVCKACRANWMEAIKSWFDNPVKKESCGSGIYVRQYGDNIEITEEEWNNMQPGRIAVRFKPDEPML